MRKLIILFLLLPFAALQAQTPVLEKLWETDTIIAIPESVLPDFQKNILYVSLINGNAWENDGVGGIGKLSLNGKEYDSSWITGLNAPKGLGKFGNHLYVADNSEVVVIDINKGKVERKIAIENASGLNDITVDKNGIVYVSDSRTSKIWQIKNDKPTLFLENIEGVNGLKSIGEELFIGAGKEFLKAGKDKSLTKVADLPQGIDGIEPVGNGDFILTAWSGYIFYVEENGKVETLLETHQDKINAADLGYDPLSKTLFVPTFLAKRVVAYRLNK